MIGTLSRADNLVTDGHAVVPGSETEIQNPQASQAASLKKLAVLAAQHGLWDQATAALEQAVQFSPEDTDLLIELGYAYHFQQRLQDALNVYQLVVALRPKWPAVYANLGSLLIAMGRTEMAIAASRICLQLDPDMLGAYLNLAAALRGNEQHVESLAAYRALLARAPENAAGLVDYFHIRQHLCDWDGFYEHLERVVELTYRRGHRVAPFTILVGAGDSENALIAGRVWSQRWEGGVPLASYVPRTEQQRARRLRIGYLSNDFYNHATALLLIELLELRDRTAFEVFGYSTGGLDDGTLIRARIISAFDVCYDLKDVSHADAAKKIRDDEIDILIDLKGYTAGARTEIMALRPAPIQVNYLGYPGTMGASFIDYIIADSYILPPDMETYYDEKVARLPDCYQPNDRKRPVSSETFTRAGCGLPDEGFVFCSFNAPYKITPDIYDLWMRILHQVPGSVLWTLAGYPACNDNLRLEAVKRGIAADRIVIAPKMVTERHLGRMRLGDLFLDTYPVAAHTTASDALWVGLPVLTCPGESFVSRVAGSLLHAVGVPELIAESFADYEAKAIALATDPAALQAIRDRLEANRLTTPLFDSVRYTRHYEAALLQMAALRDADRPPESFTVPALS